MHMLIFLILGIQEASQLTNQKRNKETFFIPPLITAQCIIGSEKQPEVGNFVCEHGKLFLAFAEVVSSSINLTKANILQAYASEKDFRGPKL